MRSARAAIVSSVCASARLQFSHIFLSLQFGATGRAVYGIKSDLLTTLVTVARNSCGTWSVDPWSQTLSGPSSSVPSHSFADDARGYTEVHSQTCDVDQSIGSRRNRCTAQTICNAKPDTEQKPEECAEDREDNTPHNRTQCSTALNRIVTYGELSS